MERSGRHVVVEGLPAVGKSEAIALLARFYPEAVRSLPELVKSVVEAEGIDLFRDRPRLTRALAEAAPRRRAEIEAIVREGYLCLEESHLGVHFAYSVALGDREFVAAYPMLERALPRPDLFIRLDIPVCESLARQEGRATPGYAVDEATLEAFRRELDRWHADRRTSPLVIDADRAAGATATDLERALGLAYAPRLGVDATTFDLLFLLGRPASGKSEFIDFMTRLRATHRARDYHLGGLATADDFPILWRLFEDDDAWERLGHPRRLSRRADGNYAVADDAVWGFLISRLCDEIARRPLQRGITTFVEFSRGGPSGYRDALQQVPRDLLTRAAVLYLSVPFEESWRRNTARYDAARRGGVLTHSVPRDEMERTYGIDDWADLTGGRARGYLDVSGTPVPFVTIRNEPESTDPRVLGPRYRDALEPLFELFTARL